MGSENTSTRQIYRMALSNRNCPNRPNRSLRRPFKVLKCTQVQFFGSQAAMPDRRSYFYVPVAGARSQPGSYAKTADPSVLMFGQIGATMVPFALHR